MKTAAIVPAAGHGQRFGGDKMFVDLAGQPLLTWTLRALQQSQRIDHFVVVTEADRWPEVRAIAVHLGLKSCDVTEGGDHRQASVRRGLSLCDDYDFVCVHDGARPLCPADVIAAVVDAAKASGAAIAALPCVDTIKRIDIDGRVVTTLHRESLIAVQTPQAFATDVLRRAHARAEQHGLTADDDSALVEGLDFPVTTVPGDPDAIKVTHPIDLAVVRAIAAARALAGTAVPDGRTGHQGDLAMRIGHGVDAHRLVPGRKLMLGGVRIDHDRGLLGHSDGDSVCHALADALLGGAGLGDIGQHFPSSDPAWQGAAGVALLREVADRVRASGYRIASAQVIAIAEEPRLAPHLAAMRTTMAAALGIDADLLAVSATSTDGMGFMGRAEGVAASAVALLEPDPASTR